jgi:membrane protease YdiL (CAAX protease family)
VTSTPADGDQAVEATVRHPVRWSNVRLIWIGGTILALGFVLFALAFARGGGAENSWFLPAIILSGLGVVLLLAGLDRRVLLTTIVAFVLSNLIPLPLLVVLVLSRTQSRDAVALVDQLRAVIHTPEGFLPVVLIQEVLFFGLAWLGIARAGLKDLRHLFRSSLGLGRLAGIGVIAGVGLFGLNAITVLVMQGLGVKQTQLDEIIWTRSLPPAEFGLIVLAGAVAAPLAEEIFFRGFVFQSYARRYGTLAAAVLSAFLFAALHANLPASPALLLLGFALAWVFARTGSLVPGIIAHGLNNGLAFGLLYLGVS